MRNVVREIAVGVEFEVCHVEPLRISAAPCDPITLTPGPGHVPGYRDTPEDIEYREREHHPICAWCKWSRPPNMFERPTECLLPGRVPGKAIEYWMMMPGVPGREVDTLDVREYNGRQQCEDYAPSAFTRATQLVRLRPFVPRGLHPPRDP